MTTLAIYNMFSILDDKEFEMKPRNKKARKPNLRQLRMSDEEIRIALELLEKSKCPSCSSISICYNWANEDFLRCRNCKQIFQ